MADNETRNSSKLNATYQKLQETNTKLQEEINKHIKTEEQLQEKSDTLKTIFESIQIGIVIINPETHKIVYANPFAVKMIRAPREKIVGAECHRFICPAEKGKCPVTDLGQNVDNSERILITAAWEERPIIKTVVPITIEGKKHLLETFVDITERKLAEEALQASEEKYRTLIENVNIGVYRNTAPKGKFVQANPATARIFGYDSVEEFLKISASDLYQNPEDGKRFVEDIKRNGFAKNRGLALRKKDGTPIWCSCTAAVKYDKKGKIQWLDGVIEDITERKKLEEEIRSMARFPSENPQPILRISCEGILLYSNEASKPILKMWNIATGITVPESIRKITGEAFVSRTQRFKEIECKDRIFSFTIVPIEKAGYVNLYGTDITDRKQAEKALHRTAEMLKRSQEISHLGSWELDVVNNILTWSDEAYLIFGLQPQEFGATYDAFLEAVHPDDRAAVDAAYSRSLRNGRDTYEIEHRVIRKSTGEIRIVHEKCEHMRDGSGRIIRSVGMVHDITERKLAEKELHKSAEEWHRTFDSISDLVFLQDNDHVILKVNKAFCDALKSKPEDIIGKKCHEILHKTNSPWPNCPFEKTKGDQEAHTEEVDDKNIGIPLLITTSPIFNDNGELIGSVHIAKDITERKKAEDELAFKNVLLTTQQEASIDGILVVDGKGKIISFNQRFIDMWGISSEIMESESDERVLQAVLKQVVDPIPFLTKVRHLYEHRPETSRDEILLIDGRTFDRYSAPMFGDKDKYYGRVWYFRDITDHKQAEEKLIELSLTDELTKLNNRRGFSILAAKQIKNADRYKHGLTLIYIDLDNMKWINDNIGHEEGDRALVDISNIFKKSFRSSDIIARLGGDEFAGLVVDSRGTTSEMILARMQESINEFNSQKIRSYNLAISFGVINYDHETPCSLNEMLERGDKAMYEHKQKKGVRRGENIK